MVWDLQTSGWHVRPARLDDLDGLLMLAESADEGMTNLPPNRRALGERIERSIHAFDCDIAQPEDELYLLVLDDGTGSIAGTACLFSKVRLGQPALLARALTLAIAADQVTPYLVDTESA